MGKKKVRAILKLELEAGKATPAPPVGTALGPHGVNIMDFCKQYNAATSAQGGEVVPVEITILEDRSFTFILKTAPTGFLLKKALGLESGSSKPGRESVGEMSWEQLREVAKVKSKDLNANDLEQATKIVAGTARSMGIKVNA